MQSFIWLMAASGVLSSPQATPVRDSCTHVVETRATSPQLGPVLPALVPAYDPTLVPLADTGRSQRPKAVRYSDEYYKRLTVHRIASYAMLPLFVAEYVLGQSLYNQIGPADTLPASPSLRAWHRTVADAIILLFGVNTYTGALNLEESSSNPDGSARRYAHAVLMIVSDIGFVLTGQLAPGAEGVTSPSRSAAHRTVAMVSIGTAVVGDAMMLIWNHAQK